MSCKRLCQWILGTLITAVVVGIMFAYIAPLHRDLQKVAENERRSFDERMIITPEQLHRRMGRQ